MWDAVQNARDRALDEGEAEAEKRLERVNDQRGYNLPTGDRAGENREPVRPDPLRRLVRQVFEYGTIYIAPRRSCDPPTGRCGSGSWMRWRQRGEVHSAQGRQDPVNEEALAQDYLVSYLGPTRN